MYVSKECENIPPPFLPASYKSSLMCTIPSDALLQEGFKAWEEAGMTALGIHALSSQCRSDP